MPTHLGNMTIQYPFWVLTFWKEATQVRNHVCAWSKAKCWLLDSKSHMRGHKSQTIIEEAERAFGVLSWSGSLASSPWDIPVSQLTTYLSTNWLSNDEMDQLTQAICKHASATLDTKQEYQIEEIIPCLQYYTWELCSNGHHIIGPCRLQL